MGELETLPLWEQFRREASDEQRVMVRELVKRASNLLDLVRDTFPTYTLHNHVHSGNVVKLMGKLLGNDIAKLSALESAILILSAYYHDIGMVFREEERDNLANEKDFDEFKKEHPEAVVRIDEAHAEIPLDVAEYYCRWIHPDRVNLFLNEIDDDHIKWGVTTIKKELHSICQSHGHDIDILLDDEAFRTDFRGGEADLRFCAISLRLADILDFDNTRSPEEVYDYLGISQRKDPRAEMSDIEWRKHLCSEGFVFPKERNGRYILNFIAEPDDPAVEYDVRQFLDTIENELSKCDRILSKCSDKWRNFILPQKISREDIHSNGYKYGEYRFALEQSQVLNLFTGENLYDDPYVFVRELLQNAIDTARHRQFFEESKGNTEYQPKIVVSHWYDHENYQWVRVDDNGMGMGEDKIINYLLKVGKSYYTSAEFEAEKLSYRKRRAEDFTPISRFGIGLLSCFIAGDRVEISTRPVLGDDAIRLSLPALYGFYTLQSEKEHHFPPKEMPAEYGNEGEYRREPGTSVAVRLDPRKERGGEFDTKRLLDRYVLCSPIPIEFERRLVGRDPKVILEKPWIDKTVEEELSNDEVSEIESHLQCKFSTCPRVKIVCLDLTKHSPTPNLKGQMLMLFLPRKYLELADPQGESMGYITGPTVHTPEQKRRNVRLARLGTGLAICISYRPTLEEEVIERAILKPLSMNSNTAKYMIPLLEGEWVSSHNGIVVPHDEVLELSKNIVRNGFVIGIICFSDSLRPEISIARERLRGLSWNIHSTVTLAFLRAIRHHQISDDLRSATPDVFAELLRSEEFLLKTILDDPYMGVDGEWASEAVIHTDRGTMSLESIRDGLEDGLLFRIRELPRVFDILHGYSDSFMKCCIAALVQIGLNVKLSVDTDYISRSEYIVDTPGDPRINEGQKLFPPMFFVPYENSDALKLANYALNRDHPFSEWLIENAQAMYERYPGILQSIRSRISSKIYMRRDWPAVRTETNKVLERLRHLDPDICPPKSIDLKDSDLEAPLGRRLD